MKKLCKCGCGKTIKEKAHHKHFGIPDYIHGHNKGKLGIKLSVESKKRISDSKKGKMLSEEHKQKIRMSMIGKNQYKRTILMKKNRSLAHIGKMMGKDNPSWKGGISFEPYTIEFNNKLKEKIRERDQYRCQQCFRHQNELYFKNGHKYKLHIHHIDYNKKNNKENNLISLCSNCHKQTNFERDDWIKYFQKKGEING